MRRVTTRGFPAWQHTIKGRAKPMNQLHTAREQRFIDMAGEMADDFAKRAAIHDEEGSFPFENYERLKDSGYTRLIIPEALLYFRGHFPGFAILPGVVQLDWAIRYGTDYFALGAVGPKTIRIKFRKPIRPNHRLTLSLKHIRSRNSIQFEYNDAHGACSSGQIAYVTA